MCRARGKPVQVHHIDDDPANQSIENLAVLCLDCHRDTQLRGGFDRKLDADQIELYRDDWHRNIEHIRSLDAGARQERVAENATDIEVVTLKAEILRDNKNYWLLAALYDRIGNKELRDKYVDLAIEAGANDEVVCLLRDLQGRPDLIPDDVAKRTLASFAKSHDWLMRGRLLAILGRTKEAVVDYLRGIQDNLEEDNPFTAAFYLKEMTERKLVDDLFVLALSQAQREDDLWWEVRALEELGWTDDLNELTLANAAEIERSQEPHLLELLALARSDRQAFLHAIRKVTEEISAGDWTA